jgi:hypothetical protein
VRRVTPPPPGPAVRPRLLTWLLAAVAVAAVLFVERDPELERGALAADFAAGRPEVALARLADAPPDALPAPLRQVRWWPAAGRASRLLRLERRTDGELLESPTQPTIVAPLGNMVEGPAEVRLRDPARAGLRLELRNVDLDLAVAEAPVPPGARAVPLHVAWIAGTRYAMVVTDASDGAMLALASFRLLDDAASRAAAEAMAAAHDLAVPSHEGSSLLAALAALDAGLALEAIGRLAPLRSAPGYEAIARELHALALEGLGLDWSARRLVAAAAPAAEERR